MRRRVDGHAGAARSTPSEKRQPLRVRKCAHVEWTATPSLDFPGSYEVLGGSYRPPTAWATLITDF
jgi:hypothetical protein